MSPGQAGAGRINMKVRYRFWEFLVRRRLSALFIPLVVAAPMALLQSPATAAPVAAKPYDFNGDGHPDLVVGADSLQVGSVRRAGGVLILPGSSKGLSTGKQVITQASSQVPGEPKPGYRFGAAFASADFNRDGFADLAIGVPADDVGGDDEAAGSVTVLLGSASGLTGKGSYVLTRAGAASDDGFGAALATADLDGDGLPELVVGAPYIQDEGADPNAEDSSASGSVTVFRGTDSHFSTEQSSVVRGVRTGSDDDEDFGSSLAVGDVEGTGGTDLVVGSRGVAYEDGDGHAGFVTVCPAGTSCRRLPSDRRYPGLASLAVGNVSGSSRPEIVLGVVPDPGAEDADGGSVFTLSLSGSGASLSATSTGLTQDTKGVPGSDERNDGFGYAVALGDLDRDGFADLVVGSPGEGVGSRDGAGRVTVVYGGQVGYRTSGNKAYDQNTRGVPGTAESNDGFGAALALSDHDRDGHLDLTVGAPGENGSGAVTTLTGSGHSFTTEGARTFGLKTLGYSDRKDAGFGDAVAG
ncbi:MAG: FG-GAP and VCBS repeat-containing protein [Janthinobacterium lividum]